MHRALAALLCGFVAGVALTLAALLLTGAWYEYRWAPNIAGYASCNDSAIGEAIQRGWTPVPGQPSPCYVRRPRLRLH